MVGLRPLQREFLDWYAQRQWSKQGLVRTICRIDAPAPDATLPAGPLRLAGVAYAGSRQVQRVEVSSDGGQSWQSAELLDVPGPGEDRWVRWQAQVMLAGGRATLVARATDGRGDLQTQAFALPRPDGGSGWPSVELEVV